MNPILMSDVIEASSKLQEPSLSHAEFYFGVLLHYNDAVLSVATRLPEGSEHRDELLRLSMRTLPARFAGFFSENWNDIQSDPVARELLGVDGGDEAEKQA